ncbi:MAG: isochorismatase family protein [Deltaproteobacteria bacterium]|nr:isochorismatase family protein [Deltaproteobacteria bacterium]
MSTTPFIAAGRTASLAMDFASGILGHLGDAAPPLVVAQVPVIHVVVGSRPGDPELDPDHRTFGALAKTNTMLIEGVPGASILPAVAPRSGDSVVIERRIGAFGGTDLRAGVSTSGAVPSSTRPAADTGHRSAIVHDGCAGPGEAPHVLLDKVLAQQAALGRKAA